ITDRESAVISIFDRGFLYGDSVYEVLRTSGGRLVDLDRHLERLRRSAAGIELTMPAPENLGRAIAETLDATQNPESYLRIMVTRGGGPITLDIRTPEEPSLVLVAAPLVMPASELYERGASLAIVGVERTSARAFDPAVKSGNYLNNIMALAEAKRAGAYEAIMCSPDGRVAEGSTSNLFVWGGGGRLATPALATGLLPGITRQRIIDLARAADLTVEEADLRPDDVRGADEAFITSSIRGVMPVSSVDGRPIGDGTPGPTTRRLMQLYAGYLADVARGA
ncbi:MAG TPA: aminotransferase class IV, partial [Kofleriaceae bacterium]|nr:aminotransferase class IV [Kofleriaceae bacterium]